jgi:amidophosphoribosyltransferase
MCGVLAVLTSAADAAAALRAIVELGMRNMQSRGQDSYGLVTYALDGLDVRVHRELGLLPESLPLPASTAAALGHVRYSTVVGMDARRDAIQPLVLDDRHHAFLAHNGNIPLVVQKAEASGLPYDGPSDSFLFQSRWRRHFAGTAVRPAPAEIVEFCHQSIAAVHGAYACVVSSTAQGRVPLRLFAFRDADGYRPLSAFRNADGTVVGFVSETCQLDGVDVGCVADLEPGVVYELAADEDSGRLSLWSHGSVGTSGGRVRVEIEQLAARQSAARGLHLCSMEMVYFMRPGSMLSRNVSVGDARRDSGRRLVRQQAFKDLMAEAQALGQMVTVTYVPESSRDLARGAMAELGESAAFSDTLIRKVENIRSFIESTQEARIGKLKRKFEFDAAAICKLEGLLVIFDDSIVRGNTMQYIVDTVRGLNTQVQLVLAIGSPPIVDRCHFGIDINSKTELVAPQTNGRVAEHFGVRSVVYLEAQELQATMEYATGGSHTGCQYCFGNASEVNLKSLEW